MHGQSHIKKGCLSFAVDKVLYRSHKNNMIIDPRRWETDRLSWNVDKELQLLAV